MYFYGIGHGSDINKAKENAIRDLITNLQVTVQFQTHSITTHNNQSLESSGMQYAFFESDFKNLRGLEVERVQHKNNQTIAHVRILKSSLQAQIAQKVQIMQDSLESLLQKCDSLSLKSFRIFQSTFKQWQNNVMLLQSLTDNFSLYNQRLKAYGALAMSKPSYNLVIESPKLDSDILAIISGELNKFIVISQDAQNILRLKIIHDDSIRLYLIFEDCKGDREHSIQIDTYLTESSLKSNKNKIRLGAIIYKSILDSL